MLFVRFEGISLWSDYREDFTDFNLSAAIGRLAASGAHLAQSGLVLP